MLQTDPNSQALREKTDHIFHAIDRINNKTDGWYDHVLPGVIIEAREVQIGCQEGLVVAGLEALRNISDGPFHVIIGPDCSDDIQQIASAGARSAGGYDTLVISGSNRNVQFTNESMYPNLARTSTSEVPFAAAMARVAVHFGWRRIFDLHVSGRFARRAAAFTASFQRQSPDATILHMSSVITSRDLASGVFDYDDILDDIAAQRGRIVCVSLAAANMRDLFAEFDARIQEGSDPWFQSHGDFVWLLARISDGIILNDVRAVVALERMTVPF
jgi:hypothetical protein